MAQEDAVKGEAMLQRTHTGPHDCQTHALRQKCTPIRCLPYNVEYQVLCLLDSRSEACEDSVEQL